jgi:hypothetical protein
MLAGALALALTGGCRDAPKPKWEGDTLVYRAPGWELRIQYTSRGTVYESQHGTLYRNGQEVQPAKPADKIETGLGWIQHYGERNRELSAPSGWHFAARDKIQRSQRVSAE